MKFHQIMGGGDMLKNNIEIDVKVKCVEEQTTQAELAEKVGTSPSYVNRLIKSPEKEGFSQAPVPTDRVYRQQKQQQKQQQK